MISVFNQLTENELADCDLFEDILNLHYEKFKYFYLIIEDICLGDVQKIECTENTKQLIVIIKFDDNKDRDSFRKVMDKYTKNKNSVYYSKYFSVKIEKESNKLNISIENKKICREEDIYEDRFNSC